MFVDLFRRVLGGTLDATSRRGAAKVGADAQAREEVEFHRDKMPGARGWWRIAQATHGEIVGFGIPSRNPQFYNVGYLGVVPEHRGNRYVDEIVAEITRLLVTDIGARVVRADTDLANQPMARAFKRTGYRIISNHLVLSQPS